MSCIFYSLYAGRYILPLAHCSLEGLILLGVRPQKGAGIVDRPPLHQSTFTDQKSPRVWNVSADIPYDFLQGPYGPCAAALQVFLGSIIVAQAHKRSRMSKLYDSGNCHLGSCMAPHPGAGWILLLLDIAHNSTSVSIFRWELLGTSMCRKPVREIW